MDTMKLPNFDPVHDVLHYEAQPLDAIFAPKSVALIGATENQGSVVWLQHAAIASVFVLVQLLFHVYPILHLRSVRGRLENLFARSRMMRRNAASDAQHVVQPDALRQPVNSTLGR